MLTLKIQLAHPNARLPVKATEHASCWDVFAADIISNDDGLYIVDLGFRLQPPIGYKVVIVPRSSVTKTTLVVQNSPGQGDWDYRGNYQLRFRTIPSIHQGVFSYFHNPFPYSIGDRVGQFYLERVNDFILMETDELDSTDRGDGAFGSTGK